MSIANRGETPPAPAPRPMPRYRPYSWDEFDSLPVHRQRAFFIVPYALLGLLAVLAVFIERPLGSWVVTLALCAVTAAWTLWMFTLHPAWRQRPRVMGVFVTGLIALNALLVIHEPLFGCFVPATYLYAFGLLQWPWRLGGVSAVAVIAATAQVWGTNKDTAVGLITYFGVIVINVLPMNGLAWFLHNSENWHQWRQQTIEDLSEANDRLAATLAENAGLHEQLMTQAREAGVLDERQRMAREIHDTLAQGLTGIITQLQAAEQGSQDPARWRRHVRAATSLARESLAEARRSVDALRPEPLETARLGDALAGVARRWSELNSVKVEVTATGTARPLPPDAELALLRTAQEALANVAKHARASRVGLTLSYMDHEVALDVRDDGSGFAPEPQGNGGFGLVAMRQRIEGVNGTLQIESEAGGGTAISACVPVTSPASGGAPE
jgi:signal transduction histidine kinase